MLSTWDNDNVVQIGYIHTMKIILTLRGINNPFLWKIEIGERNKKVVLTLCSYSSRLFYFL